MEWKWTKGEPYERSRRMSSRHQPQGQQQGQQQEEDIESRQFAKRQETFAFNASLNHDEHTWDILNQMNSFQGSNKREELDLKLAARE